MAICRDNLKTAIAMLGKDEIKRVYLSAHEVDRIESIWKSKLKKLFDQYNDKVAASLLNTGHLPLDIDFTEFYFVHALEVMGEAVRTTHVNREISKVKHLSSPPPIKVPRSFRALQKMWDLYRKTGKVPRRISVFATKVKKEYLKQCQSIWDKHTQDFRKGESFNMHKAVEIIRQGGDKAHQRAKMIVQTETTNYYNQTRKEIYDQSPEVTHYLFLAIRDQATTKWCKTRHGLVYEKGEKVTARETPAIHWNCRSEMVPLTKQNPKHAALINNSSKQRANNSPAPLPKGWTQAER